MKVTVYVEGGGDHSEALKTRCRKGFVEFFRKAGLGRRMPKVVPCGSRYQTFDKFCTAVRISKPGTLAILLVDSEAPVIEASPWQHVKRRQGDGWDRPQGASDDQLHFMVQTMEAWFYADKDALQKYYGPSFSASALSQRTDIETIPKNELIPGLEKAIRGSYSKGEDSFKILAIIDPQRVGKAAYAARLLKHLDSVCQA